MEPLANKIRPKTLGEFVGQEHLVGKGKPLRVAMDKKELFSFILWGPPGSGKTTLARMYANALNADFYELSAVDSGKEDIKNILGESRRGKLTLGFDKPKILFIDEIHRFNKAQQDFLLPFVERGDLTLVGATTENPSFEVIGALLSRARVFVLEPLGPHNMAQILSRTKIKIPKDAQEWLIQMADGDARQALNVLESTQKLYTKITKTSTCATTKRARSTTTQSPLL
jgi:putative ATPase